MSTVFLILSVPVALTLYLCIHELAHAVTALLLTRGDVRTHIGFHGTSPDSLKFRIGRLHIELARNPLHWQRMGYCRHETDDLSLSRYIAIILAGPIVPFVVGIITGYSALALDIDPVLKISLVMFSGITVLALILNLIPKQNSSYRREELLGYNDGFLIAWLLRKKGYYMEWKEARSWYARKHYAEAAARFESLIETKTKEKEIYNSAVNCYLLARDYQKADEFSRKWGDLYEKDIMDLLAAAEISAKLGRSEECLAYYDEALSLDPDNATALNNRGYTLIYLERYAEAVEDFNAAIEIDPKFAFAYNNRGLARIKLGMIEEGMSDIHYSVELEGENSYAYLNFGIYHFDRGEFSSALELFEKARELDPHTDDVDDHIARAKEKLMSAQPS